MVIAMLALSAALAATPADAQRRSLRAFLHHQLESEQDPSLRYDAAFVDLDGDGRDEAVVYLTGNSVCGSGGCDLHIYTPKGRSWREVSALSISRPPIEVLPTRTRGWRDIAVFVAGGGIIPGYEARLRFDGRSYPTNPSVAPATPLARRAHGRVLIDPAEKGRPLF